MMDLIVDIQDLDDPRVNLLLQLIEASPIMRWVEEHGRGLHDVANLLRELTLVVARFQFRTISKNSTVSSFDRSGGWAESFVRAKMLTWSPSGSRPSSMWSCCSAVNIFSVRGVEV